MPHAIANGSPTPRQPGRRCGVPWLPGWLALALCLLTFAAQRAHADVGVVLNESLDEDMDRITSTGHSAVYFSRICPETPIKLRLCGPGEQGSVMSNYINIGEDRSYEWNVVPLNIYLFGVEDARNRPLFASYKIKRLLEDRYRQNYLSGFCSTASCVDSRKAEWREMVAATLIRGVHIFYVTTSVEQDEHFIAEWNDSANQNHFNGVTHNCADFARRAIESYFPHSTKTDYLNDFGMTSPKAVARTFTHYAEKHPESQLRVMHFAQVPGTTKRSRIVRSGTEQLFHSGKLMLPEVLLAHFALPVVMTTYFTTARFNADKEFAKYPSLLPDSGSSTEEQPDEILGTDAQWKEFRKSIQGMAAENASHGEALGRKHFFRRLDEVGMPSLGADGSVWLEMRDSGEPRMLGASASNIVASRSTPAWSYPFLLARAGSFVNGPKHARETMFEFQQDWANLQTAMVQTAQTANATAANRPAGPSTGKAAIRAAEGIRSPASLPIEH